MYFYKKESIKDKFKKFIRKTFFVFFLFFLGLVSGFYFLLSGGLDKPYTYVYRFIKSDESTVTSTYKFSPILKEDNIHHVGVKND